MKQWTKEETLSAIKMLNEGRSIRDIADMLGRSCSSVRSKLACLNREQSPKIGNIRTQNIKPAIRKCLTCGDEFHSQGPHNRRCSYCYKYYDRREEIRGIGI